MKFASFEIDGSQSYGVVDGDGVIDLKKRMDGYAHGLIGILRKDGLAQAAKAADGADPDYGLDDVQLLSPIPNPEKIICIGVNYGDRNAEYQDGSDGPGYPSVFMRARETLVGHGANLIRPPESEQLDYEGEIGVIIGKSGRRIAEADARGHIAGLTCINEGTIRDWLRHGKFNVTQGKNFAASGAIGPWLVPMAEFGPLDELSVACRVNGETRQSDTTDNMLFNIPHLIHYLSTFMVLKPGDIIASGTPVGAGARFDPPKWLVPGDVVEVEVGGVGVLRNTVADE